MTHDADTELPVTEKPREEQGGGIHASMYILNWIFFSNLTILFNKWLLDSAGFRYPIILTTWHLIFAVLATQLLARTTTLLDSRKSIPISGRMYLRTIMPIGLLYSGSLVCSNVVYLYLSVAFIQMIKAAAPVAVLLCSWAWGVAKPDMGKLVNVLLIVCGVALASAGEIQFSWVGVFYQAGGIVFEAMRLIMIQVMLSGEGIKMDPLVGLYYFAPVCAFMNVFVAWVTEVPHFKWEDLAETGFGVLFLNALVAFMLNVASVSLIGKTSGLVMTLTGILKNILLVIISVMIWHTNIAGIQILGYGFALLGLMYYSLGREQMLNLWKGAKGFASDAWNGPSNISPNGVRPSLRLRRTFVISGIVIFSTTVLLLSFGSAVSWGSLSEMTSLFGNE